MKLTDETKRQADVIIELTEEEAEKLPGLIGRTCPNHLKYNGFYAVTVDGKKTLYVRKDTP